LNIGIAGTGPMELVQAPPLTELSSLTADFKVADQSLAGFVRDDTKVFSTTIRPRREGISEIPPIRFSFFDPDTESYQTVISEPIAITVNKSESLALDAIVGKSRASGSPKDAEPPAGVERLPDFTNNNATSVLVSQSRASQSQWWWMFVIAPPVVWLATWLARHRHTIFGRLPSFKSAHRRCLAAIEHAADGPSIAAALTQYIARRTGKPCETTNHAIGALRGAGLYEIANQVESYLQELTDSSYSKPQAFTSDNSRQRLDVQRETAIALTEKLVSSFQAMKKSRVRLPKRRTSKVGANGVAQRSLGLLFAAALALSASNVMASDGVVLSTHQQETILNEAGQRYAQAVGLGQTDSADAKELFQTAAGKYQLLVDSGIHNSELHANLGNAYLQSGELGRAIANYERAKQLDPSNRQLLTNLQFANTRVEGQPAPVTNFASTSLESLTQRLRRANDAIVQFVGVQLVIWTLVIASLVFWGLLIARTAGRRFSLWPCATVPLLVLLASLTSVVLIETNATAMLNAVIVANDISLHAGDGEQFDEVVSVDAAQGHRVETLGQRGNWTQVRTANGHTGWVHSKDVERFDFS
jgi:tetratricopeptide (TPR) repeat protein